MTRMPWTNDLFGDAEIEGLWSPDRQLAHIKTFEIAWTEGLAVIGQITPDAASDARAQIEAFAPDVKALSQATARDGVVVPEIVRQLRLSTSEPDAIHTGATSQDVIDTATVLTLREVAIIMQLRISSILQMLEPLNTQFGNRSIMGRTRMQAANPIRVSHRIAAWRQPLSAQLTRLADRRIQLECLQFGGATGDRSALGDKAIQMATHLGKALDLCAPEESWHTDRTALADFAGWMTITTAALGKIGTDIALMAQQGIDDVMLTGGGTSSAMPHKNNPINAELLVTLARYATALNTAIQSAVVHEQERSGSGWMLEWLALPQLTLATGRALTCAATLLEQIDTIGKPAP